MDVVSWEQAQRQGLDERSVRSKIARGEWLRLRRGWYSTRPVADDVDLHRLRLTATLAEYDGAVVASHTSAALRWDMPVHGVDLGRVHVSRREPGKPRRSSQLQVHQCHERPQTPIGNVEHPAVAVIQVARLDFLAGLVAGDDALHRALCTSADLEVAAAAVVGRDGSRAARQVSQRCDGRHESVAETLTAHQLWVAGIPVVPQFAVPGTERFTRSGQGYRADFRVEGEYVLIEFDGRRKYDSRDDLWAEKRREDRLRELGWTVVRVVWADLQVPGRVPDRVRAGMSRARATSRQSQVVGTDPRNGAGLCR